MSAHPSIEELELLADGSLTDPDAARVKSHLGSCDACRDTYEECRANQAAMVELRQALRGSSGVAAAGGICPGSRTVGPTGADVASLFPAYEIQREIHRGGQGVVYQAIQKATKRHVAIKVIREGLLASTSERARFDREVAILAQLNHPNIVTIHDGGTVADQSYFVMDYIAGPSLDAWVAAEPRSMRDLLSLFAKICDAVNTAHLRGIIHRDLKPSNIRVDAAGEPHVLDFGLAKQTGEAEDGDGPVMTITCLLYTSPSPRDS